MTTFGPPRSLLSWTGTAGLSAPALRYRTAYEIKVDNAPFGGYVGFVDDSVIRSVADRREPWAVRTGWHCRRHRPGAFPSTRPTG